MKITKILIFVNLLNLIYGCSNNVTQTHLEWSYWQNKYEGSLFSSGVTDKKLIAFTFDDGPSSVTIEILNILQKHDCRATFFWLGSNIDNYRNLVLRADREGHVIGNHSFDHPNMIEFEPNYSWQTQIYPTSKTLSKILGYEVQLYRPPYGAITEDQINHLIEKNIKIILWSITSLDWDPENNTRLQMSDRVVEQLHPGAIILFHDYKSQPDMIEMYAALEDIIVTAKQLGYQCETIERIIN